MERFVRTLYHRAWSCRLDNTVVHAAAAQTCQPADAAVYRDRERQPPHSKQQFVKLARPRNQCPQSWAAVRGTADKKPKTKMTLAVSSWTFAFSALPTLSHPPSRHRRSWRSRSWSLMSLSAHKRAAEAGYQVMFVRSCGDVLGHRRKRAVGDRFVGVFLGVIDFQWQKSM